MSPALALEFAEVQIASTLAAQLSGHSATDPASIGQALREAFESLMSYVSCHHLGITGHPRAIYTAHDSSGLSFRAAIPVTAGLPEPGEQSPISVGALPAGKAYRFTHHGPYAKMAHTYGQISQFLKEQGLMNSEADWARFRPMWEEYRNDPANTPPADLLTYIYLPA